MWGRPPAREALWPRPPSPGKKGRAESGGATEGCFSVSRWDAFSDDPRSSWTPPLLWATRRRFDPSSSPSSETNQDSELLRDCFESFGCLFVCCELSKTRAKWPVSAYDVICWILYMRTGPRSAIYRIPPDRIVCPRIVRSSEVNRAVWSGTPYRRRAKLAAKPSRRSGKRRARPDRIWPPYADRATLRASYTPTAPNRAAVRRLSSPTS